MLNKEDISVGGRARDYLELILDGKREEASKYIFELLEAGTTIKELYLHVFQAAQHEIGRLWQMNRISVAQEHYCTAATQLIMSQLYPYIFQGEKTGNRLIATCVSGELHEIGIRMVADFFELDGWDTYYLGANMPGEEIVGAIIEQNAKILAVSVTMTYNTSLAEQLITQVRETPECNQVKIMAGGFPFLINRGLYAEIGADATAADAEKAVKTARNLIERDNTA